MTGNQTQPGVRVDESLWKEFREDVKMRKGRIRGQLNTELENALRAYIDASEGGDTNDRLTRIESDIQTIAQTLSEMSETKKDSDVSPTVEGRVKEIEEIICEETNDAKTVGDGVVEMAIQRVAGYSDPTLRRYKELLQQRESLFEHPKSTSNKWVRDKGEWVLMTQHLRKNEVIPQTRYKELIGDYGVDQFQADFREFSPEHDPQDNTPERGLE